MNSSIATFDIHAFLHKVNSIFDETNDLRPI